MFWSRSTYKIVKTLYDLDPSCKSADSLDRCLIAIIDEWKINYWKTNLRTRLVTGKGHREETPRFLRDGIQRVSRLVSEQHFHR